MKRSQLIENIMKDLDGALSLNQIIAVLHLAECYGMLPPIEPGRTVMDLDLGAPEWEPEDEA